MKKSKQEIKTFIFCSFFGALSEAFSIYFNVWTYNNPSFLEIPIWLFPLWGIASIFMVRIYLFFED
ncbi:DUF2878 family protein [Candidatus Woesearchaeota archaeon]|nr:DUF2878 family protein [Candidatus Woesearchaeota archaeon]